MSTNTRQVIAIVATLAVYTHAWSDPGVFARTDAGWVCGLLRWAEDGSVYASFRGVPYAKQPVGDLRFKELEPADPWEHCYDARNEGPICFQSDILYGRIMQPKGMSEACIHANVHVPIEALPNAGRKPSKELEAPRQLLEDDEQKSAGLPIFVFIHGGGFAFGSGDSDLHGPEYLIGKKVIVITFNYRLNVFGFLSLNSSKVPGNAGLRDVATLLKWVQRNARSFGGDPDNVTLGGQSAGGVSAHLIALSKANEGLFKRVILMSGTAISSFYSPSPVFAQTIQQYLLKTLTINSTDPDEIYQRLIQLPAEKLYEANNYLIDQFGFTTFVPTVEATFPGVTPIVENYPEVLLAQGSGKDIPVLIGFTDSECETFRRRLDQFDFVQKVKENPSIIVPPKILFTTLPQYIPDIAKKVDRRYYNGTISVDGFIEYCTEGFYQYPALKIADLRQEGDAPLYMYQFSYESENSVLKAAIGLKYKGAGHVEDLTYVFKMNSLIGPQTSYPPKNEDDYMRDFMTNTFVNFMTCSKPICSDADSSWPPSTHDKVSYQDIQSYCRMEAKGVSPKQQEITNFFDTLPSTE